MARSTGREVEIKLRVADALALRRRLRALGARKLGRVLEKNTLYDTPTGLLARKGYLVRLRLNNPSTALRAGSNGELTYKGPAQKGESKLGKRYKIREERNWPVPDAGLAARMLLSLGLYPGFRYEKRRTVYRLPGLAKLQVMLDETPIGVFLELEGPKPAIDRAARLLGYTPADYVTSSYYALYLGHCRRLGRTPRHMVFPKRKKS